jgi:hypothetical protein
VANFSPGILSKHTVQAGQRVAAWRVPERLWKYEVATAYIQKIVTANLVVGSLYEKWTSRYSGLHHTERQHAMIALSAAGGQGPAYGMAYTSFRNFCETMARTILTATKEAHDDQQG